jgi:hypothetical protein
MASFRVDALGNAAYWAFYPDLKRGQIISCSEVSRDPPRGGNQVFPVETGQQEGIETAEYA